MPAPDDLIPSLREALKHSPANLSLRVHLGEMLLQHGDTGEAEKEFRQALAQSAGHPQAKLGLVESFCRQGKISAALVLLEDWLAQPAPPPQAFLWAARIQLLDGKAAQAEASYRKAVGLDPLLSDPEWEKRLKNAGAPEGQAE